VPRVTTRPFVEQFTLARIRDAQRGPLISDDIQLVYIVDDISDLLQPILPLKAYFSHQEPAVAGQRSGFQVSAIGRPMRLFHLGNNAGQSALFVISLLQLDVPGPTEAVDFQTGGATQAIIISGNMIAGIPFSLEIRTQTVLDFTNKPLDIPAGLTFLYLTGGLNQAFNGQIIWEETPTVPVGT